MSFILTKIIEKICIMTIIQWKQVIFDVLITVKNLQYFRALNNFVSQFIPRKTYHT